MLNEVLDQRPFCNIFRALSVDSDGSECERRGQVESVVDPDISKRVLALVSHPF